MTRKEAIKVIEENRIHYRDWKQSEFDKAIEKLNEPLTLADFLDWEEGVEYKCDGVEFKIEDGKLLHFSSSSENWKAVDLNWTDANIKNLQEATKIEKLKAYHVADEYSYKRLMEELEEQGYTSIVGRKPTKLWFWENYKQKTVIYCDEDKTIKYSWLTYYENCRKNKYDLIEYKKEEPKYYAIDRIGKLDNDNSYYLVRWYDEFSDKYYYGNIEKESADKLTKKDWNGLGINDSNVDFEEVANE